MNWQSAAASVAPRSRLDLLVSANRAYATDSSVTLNDAIRGDTGAQQARAAQAQAQAQSSILQQREAKFAEYAAKLQAKAQEKGLAGVDELRAQHEAASAQRAAEQSEALERARKESLEAQMADEQQRTQAAAPDDAALQERLRRQRTAAEARKLAAGDVGNSPIKPLASFLDVDKIAGQPTDVVTQLWTTYHTMANKLSATVPRDTYAQLLETARAYPQFVLPLPRTEKTDAGENEAYEMYFMQWTLLPPAAGSPADAPPPSVVLFTPLAEYKMRQEFAQPALVLSNYTELVPSKGIALLRGDVTEHQGSGSPMVSQADAQMLTMCMQRFYRSGTAASAGEDAGAEERRELMHTFNRAPGRFALDKLLEVAFKL